VDSDFNNKAETNQLDEQHFPLDSVCRMHFSSMQLVFDHYGPTKEVSYIVVSIVNNVET
jgi:hypothetical protein